MQNYHLVRQWAANIKTEKAHNELNNLVLKYPWLKCSETLKFVSQMHDDLPRILNIIILQEKQNAILRHENEKLNDYIKVNRMADELLIDEIKAKYPAIEI
jgi:hypothetical protein